MFMVGIGMAASSQMYKAGMNRIGNLNPLFARLSFVYNEALDKSRKGLTIIMKYDFTSIMDRRGKDAIAIDEVGLENGFAPGAPKEGFDIIPMWVADMNFPTCPSVLSAMRERLSHPAFGYFRTRPEYFDGIITWQKERNGVADLTADCIGYENGVLGGVASVLRAFASPGDKILVHSPAYIGFTGTIRNAGYHIVYSELKRDADGVWRMDYEDMEKKIRENGIHLAVFCNPHNPCGRVWREEEMERALDIYRRNDCIVISDEIWSDIILEGHRHIPLHAVNEDAKKRVISFYAPSKTFSLAGLIGSYHIIYDRYLRDRVRSAASKNHYNDINVLSMYALIGAYTQEGMDWVDELCEVLTGNVTYAYEHIKTHYEGIDLFKPEGTYMLFLDCADWCEKQGRPLDTLLKAGWDVGVAWQDGRPFLGNHSIRVNLASPRTRIEEAFGRLDQYVFHI